MRFVLLGLSALLFATPVLAKVNAVKIAYVDMQRALLEVEDGKKAKSTLEKMKKDRQGKLDVRQSELRKMQKDLESQKPFMKKELYEQKVMEFRQKLGELQQTYATLQRELAMEEAKLTKKIFGRMAKILAKVGKKGEYTMIFEKTESSLLWAEKHLDLTNELIRRYNAGEGK